ncbi:hypothetical protein ABT147_00435 [Streptomyces sp. NPDC001868]|uniref:hypothetical protein n=1 Tax=Streptomyces sp. NPDC001868 TaxID=3154401 RepID=UPI003317BE3E
MLSTIRRLPLDAGRRDRPGHRHRHQGRKRAHASAGRVRPRANADIRPGTFSHHTNGTQALGGTVRATRF